MKKLDLKSGSKILIVNIAGIGDQVMSIPALNALHELYPHCDLYVLTTGRCEDILRNIPFLKRIYALDFVYGKPRTYFRLSIVRLLMYLRSMKFDLAINFERIASFSGKLKMRFLLKLIRASYLVGRNTNNRGSFYDISIKEDAVGKKHSVEIMTDVVSSLGAKIPESIELKLPIKQEDDKKVKDFLLKNIIPQNKIIIGFNPDAYRPSRRWDIERWGELANKLIEHYPVFVVIVSKKNNAENAEVIMRNIQNKSSASIVSVKLSLLPALFKQFSLFVTNDTGPMHIAAAVGTPLVALFGPGDVISFRPYGDIRRNIVVRKPMECAVNCYRFSCKDMKCMNGISVEEVFQAAEKIIKLL